MSIWRLVTILLNHIVTFPNDNLSVYLFIQPTFLIFINHPIDIIMALWTQQLRQYNPCPYRLIVGKTDIKQIIMLHKRKWHMLGKCIKVYLPFLHLHE